MLRMEFLSCIWQDVRFWLESGMHFLPASLGRDCTARTAHNVLKGCCWPCRSWLLLQRRWPAMTMTALLRRLSDLFCQHKAAEPVTYETVLWVVFPCSSSIHLWFSACLMFCLCACVCFSSALYPSTLFVQKWMQISTFTRRPCQQAERNFYPRSRFLPDCKPCQGPEPRATNQHMSWCHEAQLSACEDAVALVGNCYNRDSAARLALVVQYVGCIYRHRGWTSHRHLAAPWQT